MKLETVICIVIFLIQGIIWELLANFNSLGKIPFRGHWFIIRVTGLLISCFIDFNKLVDIPQFPLLFEGTLYYFVHLKEIGTINAISA